MKLSKAQFEQSYFDQIPKLVIAHFNLSFFLTLVTHCVSLLSPIIEWNQWVVKIKTLVAVVISCPDWPFLATISKKHTWFHTCHTPSSLFNLNMIAKFSMNNCIMFSEYESPVLHMVAEQPWFLFSSWYQEKFYSLQSCHKNCHIFSRLNWNLVFIYEKHNTCTELWVSSHVELFF